MKVEDYFEKEVFVITSKLPKERRRFTYFDLLMFAKHYHNSELKLLNLAGVINWVPYQTCPKCGGDGDLSRYNSPALMGMDVPICDVCDGNKIIPMAHDL